MSKKSASSRFASGKMALPFVCVVFGLVGAALGTTQRTAEQRFGISVVVIF